ncbi:uncharacterized protein LOC112900518 [Panicum hallii]|uniref:uncharacterized protein LOC112900518 n=1 Tax=Panicum hallii TaxID=206008 RepID=UPI000DF4DFD7|nr:uncharacterized protein LOC112900518 [Panicum hallii]
MVVVTRAAKRRMLEEDGGRTSQQGEDLISLLPDAILGAIITLLLLNLNLNLKARVVTGSEEELELFYYSVGTEDPSSPPLAPSTFRCSATLRVLTLCSSDEVLRLPPAEIVSTLHFPCIKQLTLKRVHIAENSLHGILFRCPVLESLLLCLNTGCRCLRISSATLQSFGVSNGWYEEEERLEEVIVDNVPLLERLIPRKVSGEMVIRVIQAPKLKVLGYLRDYISTIQLGPIKMMPLSLSTVARTMKTSALYISPDVGVVIGLLKCFPCVETLYFESHSPRNINNTPRSDQLECLDHHLKKLVVTSYAGTESEVNFIKFFILNAKVLEFMKIYGTHQSHP